MKIAMLLSESIPPEEGIGNYVFNLSQELSKHGHEIVAITRGGLKWESFPHSSFVVYKVPFMYLYPFHVNVHATFVSRLLRNLSKDLDIVHIHSPLTMTTSLQTKIVTTFHTPLYSDSLSLPTTVSDQFPIKVLGRLAYRIEKSLILSSRQVSAVSAGVAFDLAKYYGLRLNNITVLGNAPNPLFVEAGESLKYSRSEKNILYVGRLDKQKGILDLVDGMKIVIQRFPEAKLKVIGKGPELSALRKRIFELNLEQQVSLLGFVNLEKLVAELSNATIFVYPSSYCEGLPTSVLEAMACKVPIVATNVRGNIDVVKHNKTGLLASPKDPKSLALAIVRLLENPGFRERLAISARTLIENELNWSAVAERALNVYKKALD